MASVTKFLNMTSMDIVFCSWLGCCAAAAAWKIITSLIRRRRL